MVTDVSATKDSQNVVQSQIMAWCWIRLMDWVRIVYRVN